MALARLGVLAVSRQMLPLAVIHVSPAEALSFHNLAAEYGLHARLLSSARSGKDARLVVGGEHITERYQKSWEKNEANVLDEIANVPLCCQRTHRQSEQAGYHDAIWSLMLADQPPGEQEVDIHCSPLMNILLMPLGISLLSYLPCDLHCQESLHLASSLLALGREAGLTETMDWLEEILSWSSEWSALHSIAELKTGILKVAYNTDFTPNKRTIRYHGPRQAADAVRGLSFAYYKPRNGRRSPDHS
jgi:hypothetical protein